MDSPGTDFQWPAVWITHVAVGLGGTYQANCPPPACSITRQPIRAVRECRVSGGLLRGGLGGQRGDDVRRELFEQSAGVGQANAEIGFAVDQRVHGLESRGGALFGAQQGPSRDGDRRDALSGRGRGNPDRGLAVQALLVEAALAGDDERDSGQQIVEMREVEYQLDTRPQGGVQERERTEADTAGSAGTGSPRQVLT